MSNPWVDKLGGRPTKVSLRSLAKGNGRAPGKPSLAGVVKKPLPKKQTKQDFYAGGLLYWNARITDGVKQVDSDTVVQPRGTVDVSNGDTTYTFHNRHGSWMADMGAGTMAELARVAALLGTGMGQVEMYQNVRDRFEAELKVKGILTVPQQHRAIEERQKKARERAAKKAAAVPTKKTTTKITLKGLKR